MHLFFKFLNLLKNIIAQGGRAKVIFMSECADTKQF